jgi:hypothetical protein
MAWLKIGGFEAGAGERVDVVPEAVARQKGAGVLSSQML